MQTIRRLMILTTAFVLLVPALAGSEEERPGILAGIPEETGAFSKQESEALREKLRTLESDIADRNHDEALALVRAALSDAPLFPYSPETKRSMAYGEVVKSVLRGIHARLDSPTGPVEGFYLALLREYVASTPLGWHLGWWDQAVLNWAASFAQMHGDEAIVLAAEGANDPSLPAVDRALRLQVFRITPAKDWDHPQRQLALETYRPYLDPAAPPIMQEMAVMTTRGLWDFDAVKDLEHLAFTSPSYRTRSRADTMVSLLYGRGPNMQKKNDGGMPFDLAGARAWMARRDDYQREFNRLVGMEDVAEAERAQREAEQAQASQRPAVPMMPAGSGAGSLPNDGMPHRLPPAAQ